MRVIDLKEMPGANPSVPNGMDSVSGGLVFWRQGPGPLFGTEQSGPWCAAHGAMNRMSHDGIYRCPTCHVGCYLVDK